MTKPGVTRDRTYQKAFWRRSHLRVSIPGVWSFDDDSEFLAGIAKQGHLAMAEAAVAVVVVRWSAGAPTCRRSVIAEWLRARACRAAGSQQM